MEEHELTSVPDGEQEGVEEEMSTDDLAESNQIILSALIEVLQRKGLITQAEIDAEVESIQAEDDDEDDEGDESEETLPPAA